MNLSYVPILQLQRDLYEMPRDRARFDAYIKLIANDEGDDMALLPLVIANPMAKEHVNDDLDVLLAMDADGIGERTAHEISSQLLPEAPGTFDAATRHRRRHRRLDEPLHVGARPALRSRPSAQPQGRPDRQAQLDHGRALDGRAVLGGDDPRDAARQPPTVSTTCSATARR